MENLNFSGQFSPSHYVNKDCSAHILYKEKDISKCYNPASPIQVPQKLVNAKVYY